MIKDVALAVKFKDAPKELQDAATAYYKDAEKELKLLNQIKSLKAELEIAKIAAEKSEATYLQNLAKWEIK